jgi:hypothetical protein
MGFITGTKGNTTFSTIYGLEGVDDVSCYANFVKTSFTIVHETVTVLWAERTTADR